MLGENKVELKGKKRRAKELGVVINDSKKSIDRLKTAIERKQSVRAWAGQPRALFAPSIHGLLQTAGMLVQSG